MNHQCRDLAREHAARRACQRARSFHGNARGAVIDGVCRGGRLRSWTHAHDCEFGHERRRALACRRDALQEFDFCEQRFEIAP